MIETASSPEVSNRDLEARPEPLRVDETELLGERFSIATSLEHSFAEIDETGGLPLEYYYPEVPAEVPPSDRAVAHELMKEVMKRLKESSTIKQARLRMKNEGPEVFDKFERAAVVKAFERIRDDAFRAVDMTDDQRRHLKFETISELNRSLRTAILTGAAPETWMVLDPKLKRIEALDSGQIVKYMRNLLTTKHSDAIKAEIRTIKETAIEQGAAAQALTELKKDSTLQNYLNET